MGRSESAYAFIGYRVIIKDLLEQIHDKESFTDVYSTLTDPEVFITDDNNEENDSFFNRVERLNIDDSWEENKQWMLETMAPLLNEELLIPIMELASNTRWGYNREGVHGGYSPVLDNFAEDLRRLHDECPPNHKVVWMVKQSGG
jgi:hypothetical protein